MTNKPELRILVNYDERQAAMAKLSDRQRNKLSRRDAVLAARPDGTVIVYRPTQR
jgi:hypothetical protein